MGETTGIKWCDHTWNPWEGCTKVSPGCAHCYAETRANRWGTAEWGDHAPRRISKNDDPVRWDRKAKADGVRRKVFSLSLGDWLERRPDLVEPRARLAAMVQSCQNLDFLLLTKRIENIDLASDAFGWDVLKHGLPPNVWPGVTAENQECANRRVPKLLKIPASKRFVSYEPAIGPVDWSDWLGRVHEDTIGAVNADQSIPDAAGVPFHDPWMKGLDWLIVGGESGHDARPFDIDWARDAVRQCRLAGVPVFIKQMGARPFDSLLAWKANGRREPSLRYALDVASLVLRHKSGADPSEWPAGLRVQEFPS